MTNYRLTLCDYHHLPEFKYCFTCGAPLTKAYQNYAPGTVAMYQCSKNEYHVKIWAEDRKHEDPDNDPCEGVQIE